MQVLEYLKSRNINDKDYINFISGKNIYKRYKLFSLNGQDYMLSMFLDMSDENGKGLIPVNKVLNTDELDMVAIATVEGDDIICMSVRENKIFLWLIQNGNGEIIKVADSFKQFIIKAVY